MLKLPSDVRVFIALEPCDMRRQLDGLSALVRSAMERDPDSGDLYVLLVSFDDTPMPAKCAGHANGTQWGRLWMYVGDVSRVAYCASSPDWKGYFGMLRSEALVVQRADDALAPVFLLVERERLSVGFAL